ncbi:ATP-binding protein [Qaidamihabitans albus]|uniref:ATP-binding protein n=1 Tax=Qaidamihabitans albus TaxID=2795733 RepID=UPI003556C5EB
MREIGRRLRRAPSTISRAREAHGGEGRIRSARFPARKSLEEFDLNHQRSLKRDTITHLGTLDFITGKDNVVFLGAPGTGKTHLSIGLRIRACQAGHGSPPGRASPRRPPANRARQARPDPTAHRRRGRLHPFEAEAANLFFQLVSSRYERASLIVTSNKPFGRWGEVFGDDVVATAMIDRLVHHAEVVSLKGDSTGSRTETSAASQRPARPTTNEPPGGPTFARNRRGRIQAALTAHASSAAPSGARCGAGHQTGPRAAPKSASPRSVRSAATASGSHRKDREPDQLERQQRRPSRRPQRSASARKTASRQRGRHRRE